MGGAEIAALTHSRALTIHATTLHLALAFLTGQRAPMLGVTGSANLVDTVAGLAAKLAGGAGAAQATLQDLFGNLDYCECDDCRSIIGPAAYLVDLLDYIDNDGPTDGFENPLKVLLARRPDIGALPLTCENTNTAMPYIDLVNEILEYYVGNAESLTNYPGHNTAASVDSAELVAAPQNDDDPSAHAAYTLLEQKVFPPPLPFDRDLALLRAHIGSLGSSLHEALRVLRPRDTLDPAPTDDASYYGWRDVLIERLGLSRKQVQLLTASTAVTVQDLYGYPPGTDVASEVSTLQEFSRRTGVGYDDIVAILQTRTVNPQSALLPLLQALDVPVATLQQVHTGALDAAGLAGLLPSGIDPAAYGGTQLVDVATWVTTNYDTLMQLIVIDVAGSPSDTTKMRLQHLDPDPGHAQLTMLDLYRLIRFIRLWRALNLDIATTDELIQAFLVPTDPTTDTDLERFDSGMQTVVLRCGLAYRCLDLLGLDPASDLSSLLMCWGPMSTNGPGSLYSTLFLTPTILKQNPAFAPDIEGRILEGAPGGSAPTVVAEKDILCAAFGLTSAEFDLLTGTGATVPPLPGIGLGYDATTVLNLARLSELYRHAWLARVLQISIVELRSLMQLTGIDPFSTPVLDPSMPVSAGLLDFVRLVQSLTAAGLAPVQAAYLLWNADLSGVSTPPADTAVRLAVQLRAAFATIDAQFAVPTNPTADSAKNLMALVLGPAAADEFFGLLTGTYVLAVPFSYSSYTLPAVVVAAAPGRIAYDDLGKQLTFAGYLDASTATALQAAAGADATLVAGIGALAAAATSARASFLDQYANETLQLAAPFDAYFASPDATVRRSFSALLGALLPILAARRKQLQSLAVISSATGHDQSFANALLTERDVVHASTDPSEPAVTDLIAVGIGGLTAEFHSDNNLGSAAVLRTPSVLDFGSDVNPLPAPTGGATGIAARWTGFVVADQAGTFGLQVRANAGATVAAQLGGVDVQLATTDGTTWLNQLPIILDATVPSSITITATNLASSFHVLWETTGTGWRPVPSGNLYAAADIDAVGITLTRFFKIAALATDLGLAAADLAFLATRAELTVGGVAWTTQLAVGGIAPPASYAALTTTLRGLLTYAALKAAHGRSDDRVLAALTSLVEDGAVTKLATVTGWDADSLSTLSTRIFGVDLGSVAGPLSALDRLAEAFGVLATCKLPAPTLIAAASVVPTPAQVQTFQSAVRSRYAEPDWLTAVQAINDQIRTRQRDALVAYVLLQSGPSLLASLGVAASPNRVPTADDLFNFFLVDTEMASCMLTSRIRHALSSIQLFIERCLRNLEPQVNPKDIDGSQWVWRKRYRVWQANREVFLWPENWMDESLRDDQSPFFKSTLSQLLQSDITNDSAATAYLDSGLSI
jgi:Salmonella virulence plasmid 28.1kDa A protein